MVWSRLLYSGFLVWLSTLIPVFAQTFQISALQGNNVSSISNGGVISLPSIGPGQAASVKITLTYLGGTSVELTTAPQLFGSSAFTVAVNGSFPLTLKPSEKLSFDVSYVVFPPVGTVPASGQISLPYVESRVPTNVAGALTFSLFGTTPDLTLSYLLQSNGNILPLVSGSTLLFPETNVNTSSDATILVSNRGSGAGTVTSISVTGDAFQPLGLPGLPFAVPAGSELRFFVRYLPRQARADTGALEVTLGTGSLKAALQGTGVSSSFSYELVQSGVSSPLAPGQAISLGDTKVGLKNNVDIRVRNSGTAVGTISAPVLSGDGFSITDAPRFPQVLNPSDSFTMTLTFTPAQPGPATGRLRIANDAFDLSAVGIGPRLELSYAAGSETVTVVPGNAIVFNQQRVGQTSSRSFTIKNTGTARATVISIGVAQSQEVFGVGDLPPLPAVLDPDQSVTFSVAFSPVTTGLSTANLLIDSAIFLLSGLGTTAVPLPAYRFSGAQGVQDPFQQPAVALSLASPYSIAVKGILSLNQDAGSLLPDPSVQFATGGQAVAFTIPADTTDAVFPNGAKQVRFQTGSVAGAITLTPSFATQGGLDLTPPSPPALQLTVARSVPRLLSAQVTSRSTAGFTLTITGFTTSRSLNTLELQFTAASDVSLPESKASVSLAGASLTWFQNPLSQAFGGQFSVATPFSLRVSSGTVLSPIDKLLSVSVTATNEAGTSNTLSTGLQ